MRPENLDVQRAIRGYDEQHNIIKIHLHISIYLFLNFLVFIFQKASEQNIGNGNTHLCWTVTKISAFCEPVKWQIILDMFTVLGVQ